jgi:hypothetical protein
LAGELLGSLSSASAGISAASAQSEMRKITNKGLDSQSNSQQESRKGITEQSQGRLVKKIILFGRPSFSGQSRRFLILQPLLQPLEFLLQGVDFLAGFGNYFYCTFQLLGGRLNFLLQPSLVRFQGGELGGEGLQRRYDSS